MLQFYTDEPKKSDPNSKKDKHVLGAPPSKLVNNIFCQIHGIVPCNHFDNEQLSSTCTRTSISDFVEETSGLNESS